MSLVRHNINVFADELERLSGGIDVHLKVSDMPETEAAYWLGVRNMCLLLLKYDTPENWVACMGALKLHFDGGSAEEIIKAIEQENTDA